uniref:Uncharacterized protein n=1 Tax=Anopheles dirus TaxID=7168 RepID=A0A182NR68_9DIPT
MDSLRQKIRNVFSWQHDDYSFEPVAETPLPSVPPVEPPKENKNNRFLKGSSSKSTAAPPKGVGNRSAKINKKRLNQISIARNSSITSAQLNAAVPLVNIRRAPSDRSVLSEIDRHIVSRAGPVPKPFNRPITVAVTPATSSISGRSLASKASSSRASSSIPSTVTHASKKDIVVVRKAPPAPVSIGSSSDNGRSLLRSTKKQQPPSSTSPPVPDRSSIKRKPLLSGFGRQR